MFYKPNLIIGYSIARIIKFFLLNWCLFGGQQHFRRDKPLTYGNTLTLVCSIRKVKVSSVKGITKDSPHNGSPHNGSSNYGSSHNGSPHNDSPHNGSPLNGSSHNGSPHNDSPHNGSP